VSGAPHRGVGGVVGDGERGGEVGLDAGGVSLSHLQGHGPDHT